MSSIAPTLPEDFSSLLPPEIQDDYEREDMKEARAQVYWWQQHQSEGDDQEFCLHYDQCKVKVKYFFTLYYLTNYKS